MTTTIKITKRVSGYTALITWTWGAKTRLLGYATKDMAIDAANKEIDKKRQYTLDKDM